MADDRMRKDDLDRNMGGAGQHNQGDQGDFGKQQSPGRKQDDDLRTGQRGGSDRQTNEPGHFEDDFGTSGKPGGGFGQGGQNQNR